MSTERGEGTSGQDEARQAIEAYVYKRNPDLRSVVNWLENWSSKWDEIERRKKELLNVVELYGDGKKDKILRELKLRNLV